MRLAVTFYLGHLVERFPLGTQLHIVLVDLAAGIGIHGGNIQPLERLPLWAIASAWPPVLARSPPATDRGPAGPEYPGVAEWSAESPDAPGSRRHAGLRCDAD